MSGKLAVIVDDEWEARALLKPVCAKLGFDVAEADSGDAYENAFHNTDEAVLILDMMMPHQSGMTLFDFLATNKPAVPLIIVTGHGRMLLDGTVAMAKEKGLNVVGAFTKPVNFARLEKVLTGLSA